MTLRELIEEKYGSIDNMALKVDISRCAIFQLLNGSKANPRFSTLYELKNALNITFDELCEMIMEIRDNKEGE